MPPYKQVSPLQQLSLHKLSDQLGRSLASLANGTYARRKASMCNVQKDTKSHKLGSKKLPLMIMVIPTKEVQRIKRFLDQNIPKCIRNDLFANVLQMVTKLLLQDVKPPGDQQKSNGTSFSDRLSQLDEGIMYVHSVLISQEITSLDFTSVLHDSMKWIDGCRLSTMDPKESQVLNYSDIETIFLKHFAQNAKLITNLVFLTWPHLISGNLVRIIGRHLKNLRELTMACSCETGPFIEEERKGSGKVGSQEDLIESLKSLYERCPGDFSSKTSPGCPKLRRLILPNLDDEEGKGSIILADALLALKYLENVSGISTLVSLTKLRDKHITLLTLPLKTLNDYDPFKQRVQPDVEFLKNILPNLDSIELRVSEDLTNRILSLFPSTHELSIECPNFHKIAKNYKDLVYLNISLDFQSPWPLLLVLGKSCKSLKYLTLEHPTFKIDPHSLQHMKYPKLPNLKFLKLIRSSFIEFVALHELIRGCPQLIELFITLSNDRNYSVDEFCDDLINAIAPHMKQLERFSAECLYKFNLYLHPNCTLTIQSVYTIIQHCPNITFIGHLDSWDVKDKDIKVLSEEIERNNWDLEVV